MMDWLAFKLTKDWKPTPEPRILYSEHLERSLYRGNCLECGIKLVVKTVWQRRKELYPDCRMHQAKGLCRNCYNGHHRTTDGRCIIIDCSKRDIVARGMCRRHYKNLVERARLYLDDPSFRTCSVDGCPKKHHAKGLCSKHYLQQWKKARRQKRAA